MQNHFGLLDTDVMPMFMIIALDIVITMCFSINCLVVICSPTVIYAILRQATSETYGPRVYFTSYKFPIYNSSLLFILQFIYFCTFTYLLNLSLLDLTLSIDREGIDNPFFALCASVC